MKIEIEESPYGDTGAVYDGMLGMFNHYILQLKSFRSPSKTKEEAEHLEADIRGYEEVLRSGLEENAVNFMMVKHAAKGYGVSYENNERVVEAMKAVALWKEPK